MKPWAWLIVVFFALGAAVAGLGLWAVQMQRAAEAMARETAAAAAAQSARAEAEAARAEAEGAKEQNSRGAAPGARAESAPGPHPDGSGDEVFYVTSITIDGLDKAGLKAADLADIEIDLDHRPGGLGRPNAKRVAMGRLMNPESPLRLYLTEVNRMAAAVVKKINEQGLIGVYVSCGDPGSPRAHPADGALRWDVYVGTIVEVKVEDRRAGADPAEAASVRERCPLKVGDHVNRTRLDEFIAAERQRLGTGVDVAIGPGQELERVTLSITIGAKE
jgi:hemolysin activation/secretion protein